MSSIGEVIINLFADAAIAEAVKIGTQVLVPTTYQVYLHEEDYQRVLPLFPQIREEAQKRLEYRVNRQNRIVALKQNFLSLFIPQWLAGLWEPAERLRNPAVWLPPRDGWQILTPIKDPEVQAGFPDVRVELILPQRGAALNGNVTMSIKISGRSKQRVVTETIGASTAPAEENLSAGSSVADSLPTDTGVAYAVLRYRDDEGQKECQVRQERVVIGRGSYDNRVDVEVVASNKVSRQHCVIRRAARGKFLIEDTSKEGTWVGAEKVEPQQAAVLPPKARISLAQVLELEFELIEACA